MNPCESVTMELLHGSQVIFLILATAATGTAGLDVTDALRKDTLGNISQASDESGEDYIVGEHFLLLFCLNAIQCAV